MSPSLIEIFEGRRNPDDPEADIEDMSYQKLKLKEGFKFGVRDLGGEVAHLDHIDPNGDCHKAHVEDVNTVIEFGNDEDVYEG